jgi:molecular chaperone DnaJ
MKVPAGTQSGSDFKLSGHGVPRLRGSRSGEQQRGAHIVTIVVDTPTKLNKKQQELLAAFQAEAGTGGKRFWS